MNKFIICLFSLFCVFLIGRAQVTDGFLVSGVMRGLPNGTKVYLVTQEKDTILTDVSKGEHFTFRGKLPLNGRFHFIAIDSSVSKVRSKAVFLVNGEMSIEGILGNRDLIVDGSTAHNEYKKLLDTINAFTKMQTEIGKEIVELTKKLNLAKQQNDTATSSSINQQLALLRKRIDAIAHDHNNAGLKWIRDHPSSLYAPYVIRGFGNILETEGMRNAYNELSSEAKESYYGSELSKELDLVSISSGIKEGAIIPNFTVKTLEGQSLEIHNIIAKGKITLIDCWASWCAPCRAEIPAIKELYERYKSKGLNILAISSDRNKGAWRKAIVEEGVSWLNVIEDEGITVTKLFDLKAIPAYILVDSKGKLIAFDRGMSNIAPFGGSLRGDDLEKTLISFLNK